jgi:transcription-repair coupling factor (superfamily II helicase)
VTGPLRVVVAPVRSLLQPLVAGLGELSPVALRAGQDIALEDAVRALAAAAYTRVDLVERRGEFAVRGGILDVFPPTEEHPLRVDFWGDTVEEVRWFAVADQRSLEVAEGGLWAPPCRELLLDDVVRARAALLAVEHPGLADVFGQLAEGIAVEGMESLAPVLVDRLELLPDLLPAGTHVLLCDPERIRTRAHDLVATGEEFLAASWAAAAAGGKTPLDLGAAAYRSLGEVREHARRIGVAWWSITPFAPDVELAPDRPGEDEAETLPVEALPAESYRGDTDRALDDVRGWLALGWRVVLVTEGHGPAERLHERLREAGIAARLDFELSARPEAGEAQVAHVSTGTLERGFLHPGLTLAVLTETDLVGQRASTKDMRRLPSKRRHIVDPLQLKAGDYVVHEQHGVGRYVEMVQRTVAGATREYLVLEYAASKRGQPGDRLYVPTDQLDQVTRTSAGRPRPLHRLGGVDWAKAKGRARKAVREIAAELIRLYSARTAAPGYAFSPDTPWQRSSRTRSRTTRRPTS